MRILFLAHRLPFPPDKGDKIRSFRELEALVSRHEVDLFSFYDQPSDRQYFAELSRYVRSLCAEPVSWLASRTRAGLALSMRRPFTTAFFYSRKMERRIQKAVAEGGYDLIFVYGSAVAPYVQDVAHIPKILDLVDVDSDKWRQYARYSNFPVSWVWSAEAERLSKFEKQIVRDFSLTLVSTNAEAEILRSGGLNAPIEVLENRIDTIYFDPAAVNVPPEIAALQPYVIFTGSMDYFPNIDAVTTFCREVFPRVRDHVPNARFVVAGRNPATSVRRLARQPGVHVTGMVSDIRPYLRGASAAVAPLRIARGIQTKIFEAMAMDLPVAVSRKAAMAMPEYLRNEVQIADDPRDMASCLIPLLRTPRPEVGRVRGAVTDYVERVNWKERWESLIVNAQTTAPYQHVAVCD